MHSNPINKGYSVIAKLALVMMVVTFVAAINRCDAIDFHDGSGLCVSFRSKMSVFARHDNRLCTDIEDHRYGTSIASYSLSNLKVSGIRCHSEKRKGRWRVT